MSTGPGIKTMKAALLLHTAPEVTAIRIFDQRYFPSRIVRATGREGPLRFSVRCSLRGGRCDSRGPTALERPSW
jgi:hypothetical protein